MAQYDAEVVYRTAELFLEQDKIKRTAGAIANQVNKDLNPAKPLTRETVYRVLAQAKSQGIIRLVPPTERQLTMEMERRFPECFGRILVVNTLGKNDNAKVAMVAADLALEAVREIGKTRATNTVGLGLGPGRATLDFCRYFSALVSAETHFPRLRLVAISAGCPAKLPEYASSSFFNLFPAEIVAEKIGLFAESVVRVRDLPRVQKSPGVHEAFDAREGDAIDIVISSMGDFSDPHDLLGLFLDDAGMRNGAIQKKKWVGNVQYRPYTNKGPVQEGMDEYRAVTLFELSDLVEMSKRSNKHVILIARQCGICEKTRAKALLPLLTNSNLRVFSQLVVDAATAKELLKPLEPHASMASREGQLQE